MPLKTPAFVGTSSGSLSDWDDLIPEKVRRIPRWMQVGRGHHQMPEPIVLPHPMYNGFLSMAMPKPVVKPTRAKPVVKPSRKRVFPGPGPPGRYVMDAVKLRQEKAKMLRNNTMVKRPAAKALDRPKQFLAPKAKTRATKRVIICID